MATLLAIRGPLTGARIKLEEGENSIGRAPECRIIIPDGTVSRQHSMIRQRGLAWLLEDCGSSAGTLMNGRPVKAPQALSPNDEIRIGHSVFLFDTEFDLQNADFTDNSVFLSGPQDETIAINPVATLDMPPPGGGESRDPRESRDAAARQGMDFLTELGELFDSAKIPFGDALRHAIERMARMLRSEVALLMLYDHGAGQLRASAAVAGGDVLADRSVLKKVFNEKRAILLSDKPNVVGHPASNAPKVAKSRSVVAAPLVVDNNCLGLIYFERHELDAYTLKDLRLTQSLGRLMGVFIEARQRAEMISLKANFVAQDSAVIGQSRAFRSTMDLIRRVAETPATVLLIGETGTGKEVLAAEIHRISPRGRQGRPFIAINCAAIAESLFESELFGHERGAFTGAHRMRQGYIEQAQGGTLFLDEIGELSTAMQPKLLRFLQEHTFTRVGGNRVLRAEVRIIAATNRKLWKEVEGGRFREDLFHRLNVLPVEVPPLRERREDIRLLSEHFVRHFSRQIRKDVIGISDEALIALERYEWPGNVRELTNCIERAVLLADDKVLLPRHFFLTRPTSGSSSAIMKPPTPMTGMDAIAPHTDTAVSEGATKITISGAETMPPRESLRPLADIERAHIILVLKACNQNQVRASEILGIHRNTLRKKLQEYGILE